MDSNMEPIYPVKPPIMATVVKVTAALVPSKPLKGNNLGRANHGSAATAAQSNLPSMVDRTTPTANTDIKTNPWDRIPFPDVYKRQIMMMSIKRRVFHGHFYNYILDHHPTTNPCVLLEKQGRYPGSHEKI